MSGQYLICGVHDSFWAVPISHVVETMRPLPTEALSDAPPFVLGLTIVRGDAIPVIDAAALHGTLAAVPATRFVVLRTGTRRVALAVQSVRAVRELSEAIFQELPSLARRATVDAVSRIGTLDEKLLFVLEATRLISDSEWSAIDASGAPA